MPTKESWINIYNFDINMIACFYKLGEPYLQTLATKKTGSIEIAWGTIQSKSAENWDDKLTPSAHLHTMVGYTLFLYFVFRARA